MRARTRRRSVRIRRYRVTALIILAAAVAYGVPRPPARVNVLVAGASTSVSVMDFSAPMALDPVRDGWWHRTFWTGRAALFSLADKGGIAALRVSTDNSASMLQRFVHIDLAAYPLLSWQWLIEKPIDSVVDERTDDGDDHPARLFIAFRNAATSSFAAVFRIMLPMAVTKTSVAGTMNVLTCWGCSNAFGQTIAPAG